MSLVQRQVRLFTYQRDDDDPEAIRSEVTPSHKPTRLTSRTQLSSKDILTIRTTRHMSKFQAVSTKFIARQLTHRSITMSKSPKVSAEGP